MSDVDGVPQIDPTEAQRHIDEGAVLLDVRETREWQAGRAPVARHLPMGQVSTEHPGLPRDRQIVVICRSGGRSQQVARFLRANGVNALNLAGGMQAWEASGLPVVADGGGLGTVV